MDLQVLTYGGFIGGALLLVAAVVLFFVLRIPGVFNELTRHQSKRLSGKRRTSTGRTTGSVKKTTSGLPKSRKPKTTTASLGTQTAARADKGAAAATELLDDKPPANATVLLGEDGNTGGYTGGNTGTTLLGMEFRFQITRAVMQVHSDIGEI